MSTLFSSVQSIKNLFEYLETFTALGTSYNKVYTFGYAVIQ